MVYPFCRNPMILFPQEFGLDNSTIIVDTNGGQPPRIQKVVSTVCMLNELPLFKAYMMDPFDDLTTKLIYNEELPTCRAIILVCIFPFMVKFSGPNVEPEVKFSPNLPMISPFCTRPNTDPS